jgi:hypothetical protein
MESLALQSSSAAVPVGRDVHRGLAALWPPEITGRRALA